MIEAIIEEVCIIDGKPLKESEIYQFHLWLWGEERARCIVGENTIYLNHPPPKGDEHESTSMAG